MDIHVSSSWGEPFCDFLDKIGCDMYGHYSAKDDPAASDYPGVDTLKFSIRPYDWMNDNDEPNFVHKPSGYKIWWYKYPMRGASANKHLTEEEFLGILQDCLDSVDGIKQYFVGVLGLIKDPHPEEDAAYRFYLREYMHGLSLDDTDKYALLNTLFGCDIGRDNAFQISDACWKRNVDVLELDNNSADFLREICESCDLHLDFQNWHSKKVEYYIFY